MDWLRTAPQLTVIRNGIKTFSFQLKKKEKEKKNMYFFVGPAKTEETQQHCNRAEMQENTAGSEDPNPTRPLPFPPQRFWELQRYSKTNKQTKKKHCFF